MRIVMMFLTLFIIMSSSVWGAETASSVSIDHIQVLRISPNEGKAVVRMPDNRALVIKAGDSIGHNARVIEVVEGRIVIEEKGPQGIETVIIRVEDGKQRVERIRKAVKEGPALYSPSQEAKPK